MIHPKLIQKFVEPLNEQFHYAKTLCVDCVLHAIASNLYYGQSFHVYAKHALGTG